MNNNLAKNFLQGLIYPSILGTFVMLIIDKIVAILKNGSLTDYLTSLNCFHITKLLLIFSIVAFYCCDYLYSMVTKGYLKMYVLFDSIVILGSLLSFNAAMSISPNAHSTYTLHYVTIPFILFFSMFLYWDVKLYREKSGDEKAFYRKLWIWEVISLPVIVLFYTSFIFNWISFDLMFYAITLIILFSMGYYMTRINEKERIEKAKT